MLRVFFHMSNFHDVMSGQFFSFPRVFLNSRRLEGAWGFCTSTYEAGPIESRYIILF